MTRNIYRGIKAALMIAVLLCCMALFSACGAVTYSELTVDENFSGKRVITSTLSLSDLNENVTGGSESIEGAVKKYKPSCMTYVSSKTSESLIYTFTFEFDSIEDYRDKMASIIAEDPSNKDELSIQYENIGSPFKSYIYLDENVNSVDLLGWLRAGLEKEGVVTYSETSNWFENTTSTVKIGNEETECYDNLYIENDINNCPEEVKVYTYFLPNGNFDRTFNFYFYEDTITDLSAQGFDIKQYFTDLIAEKGKVDVTIEDGDATYKVTVKNLSQEQIEEVTKKVMGDENITFSVSERADVNKPGRMIIDINENLRADNYLDKYSKYDLISAFFLFDGSESCGTDSVSMDWETDDEERQGFSYMPYTESKSTAKCSFTWDIKFDDIGIELDFSNNKVSNKLLLSVADDMLPAALDILDDAVTRSVPGDVKLSDSTKDGVITYTVDFGNVPFEDAASRYKEFIYNYSGEKVLCSFESKKCRSGSPFYKLTEFSADIYTGALSDEKPVKFTFIKPALSELIITENTSITPDEEQGSNYTGTFTNSFTFNAVSKSTNLTGIIAVIFLAVSGLIFVVLVLMNLKGWIEAIKKNTPEKTVTPPQDSVQPSVLPEEKNEENIEQKEENEENKEENEEEEEFI